MDFNVLCPNTRSLQAVAEAEAAADADADGKIIYRNGSVLLRNIKDVNAREAILRLGWYQRCLKRP